MTGYIPGHSFGQYLSGLSRAYAVTGDKATQAEGARLVKAFASHGHDEVLPGLQPPGVHLRQDELRPD
jgi:hypothetical protein